MYGTLAKKTLLCLATGFAGAALLSAQALAGTGGTSVSSKHPSARSTARHIRSRGTQIATWFGPGFYGQKTACGQTMTPVIVGVASRTLPCGTLVLVAYAGHRLTVPVIDRGPYAHNGALWDLTWGAASALSIKDTVRVKTRIVGIARNDPLLGAPAEMQLGISAVAAASGGTAAG